MSYKDYTQKNAPWDSDSWTEDERTQWAQDDTAYRDYGVTRCLGCMELHSREYEICPECGYVSGMMPENPLHIYPGTYLKNRYIIGKVIGSGGFGITYIAWDTLLKTKVAVKEYLPSEFSTRSSGQTKVTVFTGDKTVQFTDGKDKFVDEAKRLAKFQNESGIVKIFDSFEENNTAYIIMEYLDGCTLGEYLDINGKMDADKAIELITPVIESLNSVHEVGIIHRDVAPDNIFVTKNGDVKLIDFGASRYATTSKSRSLSVLIKPGYSPEEQYRSRGDQGPHTDVYSLAATLYKMITGVTPPDALERRAFYEKKKKDILEPITKYNKEITDNQQAAIYNALNIKIEDRTPNTVTLLGELTSETKVKRNKGTLKKIDPLTWPLWLKIGIPAALVVFITLGILLATGVIGPKRNVQTRLKDGYILMPDYIGETFEDADRDFSAMTDGNGNPIYLTLTRGPGVEGGKVDTIYKTNPTAGMAVKAGTPEDIKEIIVNVCLGTPVNVPYSLGAPYDAAMFVDFEVEIIEKYSYIKAGCVIEMSLEGGSNAQKGDKITITISKGSENSDTNGNVINFVGMTFQQAMAEAEENGIVIYTEVGVATNSIIQDQEIMRDGSVLLTPGEIMDAYLPERWDMTYTVFGETLSRLGFTNIHYKESSSDEVSYGIVFRLTDEFGLNEYTEGQRIPKNAYILVYYNGEADNIAESTEEENVTVTEYNEKPETTRRQPITVPVTEPVTEEPTFYYEPEEESAVEYSSQEHHYTTIPGWANTTERYETTEVQHNERTVNCYDNDSNYIGSYTATEGYDLQMLPFERAGYEFKGWYDRPTGGRQIRYEDEIFEYDLYAIYARYVRTEPEGYATLEEIEEMGAIPITSDAQTQYMQTTTNRTGTAPTGYTYLSDRWVKTGTYTVEKHVDSWPAGSDETHGFKTSKQSIYSSPLPTNSANKRYVQTGKTCVGYVYWHWCYEHDIAKTNCKIGDWNGENINGHITDNFHHFSRSTPLTFGNPNKSDEKNIKNYYCDTNICPYTYWWIGKTWETQLKQYKYTYDVEEKEYTYYRWTDSYISGAETRTVYGYYFPQS